MTQQSASSAAVGPGSDILMRLRTESRAEHEAIEQELDLVGPGLTRPTYISRLEQLYGSYAPLEARLAARGVFDAPAAAAWPASGLQRKTPLLIADLDLLGGRAPAQLPLCKELPELVGAAEVLGCLYVLEGATLGGQVISRHLRSTLGIGAESGGRFFHGYGAETGPKWRAFSATLVAFAREHGQQERMVRSAIATFRAMRAFCREAGERG